MAWQPVTRTRVTPRVEWLVLGVSTDRSNPVLYRTVLGVLDNDKRQKVNDYKGKLGLAPSAGFEPATPGLGNRCSIP